MGKLDGRVGIITGAAKGIGAAGATLFASEGASLVLVDIDEDLGRSTADGVAAAGGDVTFVRGDASDEDDVRTAVATAVEAFGKLDLLWSNVGIGVPKTVPDTTLDEWNRVLAVNLTSAFLLGKHGIPRLAEAGGGTMVISGSANSVVGERSWAAYCATKGGLLMLCRAMALDHAPQAVRVNIVCPGSVATDLHDEWVRERLDGRDFDAVREEDRLAHPLGRFGTPEDVAKAALFLSCDDSAWMTGAPLFLDGGVTAQ
jgi:NAD(P)-dependent dehydrogenase (short-subunit alcohol dehydrogenase family)